MSLIPYGQFRAIGEDEETGVPVARCRGVGAGLRRDHRHGFAGDSGRALADRRAGRSFCAVPVGGCRVALGEAEGAAGGRGQVAAQRDGWSLACGCRQRQLFVWIAGRGII